MSERRPQPQPQLPALRQEIAIAVRAGRANLSLSQRDLGEVSGHSQSMVARLEAESADPQLSSLTSVLDAVGVRLAIPRLAYPTRMAGEYVRDEAGRRLPAHLESYRLSMPHDWWPGTTDIRMWPYSPKWSFRRR